MTSDTRIVVDIEHVRWQEMFGMNDCSQQAALFYSRLVVN